MRVYHRTSRPFVTGDSSGRRPIEAGYNNLPGNKWRSHYSNALFFFSSLTHCGGVFVHRRCTTQEIFCRPFDQVSPFKLSSNTPDPSSQRGPRWCTQLFLGPGSPVPHLQSKQPSSILLHLPVKRTSIHSSISSPFLKACSRNLDFWLLLSSKPLCCSAASRLGSGFWNATGGLFTLVGLAKSSLGC